MFFFALLVCWNAESVGSLVEWAPKVMALESERCFRTDGTLPNIKAEWRMAGKVPGASMLAPLHAAYNGTWDRDKLDAIGAAMQAWRGPGRVNGLDRDRLNAHRLTKLTA